MTKVVINIKSPEPTPVILNTFQNIALKINKINYSQINWQSKKALLQYFYYVKGMLIKGAFKMNTVVYVYILQSMDGSYHTGCCDELAIVLAKYDKYKKLLAGKEISPPVKLVHQQKFKTELEASMIEREMRHWSKKQKQFLINNNWHEISKLAKKFL